MNYSVTSLVYRGKETFFDKPLTAFKTGEGPISGCTCAKVEGYFCKRCNGNEMYIRISKFGSCIFCSKEECLKDDADTSKGMKKYIADTIEAASLFQLGHRYMNASLSKWLSTDQNMSQVLGWLKHPKNMLILQGIPNTGKTYFCAAVANYLLDQHEEVFYTNIRRFFESVQAAIGSNQNQYQAVAKIAGKKFLIIDDLGASTNSDWQKEILLDLIDRRYSSNLPTIITTNLSVKDLNELLGERTGRRIFDKDNIIIKVKQND